VVGGRLGSRSPLSSTWRASTTGSSSLSSSTPLPSTTYSSIRSSTNSYHDIGTSHNPASLSPTSANIGGTGHSTIGLTNVGGIFGGLDYQIDSGYFGATREGINRHNATRCTICSWTHELFAQLRHQELHAGDTLARSAIEQQRVLIQLKNASESRDKALNESRNAQHLVTYCSSILHTHAHIY
jgi:hypothetical protein